MNALSPRDAYRLWAPAYEAETAISHLEDEVVRALTPPLDGLRLLDAGCGTGRRLIGTAAREAVGVDISPEMLDAGIGRGTVGDGVVTKTGDLRSLPLPEGGFDVAWCRLAIGHLPDCRPVYGELARVTCTGGRVIVSDFHPAAYAAGHRRTFRAGGAVHEVEHHVHDVPVQLEAAREAGLESVAVEAAYIGPSVRHFYDSAGRAGRYDDDLGLPVVLALSFRKVA